jgi:hypothetical protein
MLPAGPMAEQISMQQLLDVVGELEWVGGVSLGLIARTLSVDEQRVARAWEHAHADGLLKLNGRDPIRGEQLWRLRAGGWAARHSRTQAAHARRPASQAALSRQR